MILEEETFEKFGYYPKDLLPQSNKKILGICDECGTIRVSSKQKYRPLCKLCTRWKQKGKNNPNWKGGLVKQICAYCGGEFPVKPVVIRSGWGKFCSHPCSRKFHKIRKHQTKPELIFETICKKHDLPFKYTGDGSFWIGKNPSVNPDFIECNGKKIAIEVFGDYWHSPLLNHRIGEDRTLHYRKTILKKYGWKLVALWELDLKREDAEQFVLSELRKGGTI